MMPSSTRPGRRPTSARHHDVALDASESLRAVQAWDEGRMAALAQAYRAMGRPALMPPTWHAALARLDHLADALALAERATAERAEVAETFAHVHLARMGAGLRDALHL